MTVFSDVDESDSEEEEEQVTVVQLMEYYKPTWLAVVGLLCSLIVSSHLPIFGFLLSKMVFTMMDFPSDDFEEHCYFWVWMFLASCIGLFVFTYIQKLAFGIGAENLTSAVRYQLFEAILYKHIGWFDDRNRAPGVLGNII